MVEAHAYQTATRPVDETADSGRGAGFRLALALGAVLLLLTACSGDRNRTGQRVLPTPRPEPTLSIVVPTPTSSIVTVLDQESTIVGLAAGELLAIHALPGEDQRVVGEVERDTELEMLGEAFITDDGASWRLVRAGSVQGWMLPSVAFIGPPRDVTAELQAAIGGIQFESVEAMALELADRYATGDPKPSTTLVERSDRPPSAAVDVLGFGDDSLAGVRLFVVGSGAEGSVQLQAAQEIPLCSRGLSADGLCI